MRKLILILFGCSIVSISCSFTSFIGEPRWARYSFHELARIQIEADTDEYLSWVIVDDPASGTVIFDVYDGVSLTDQFYYWNGSYLLEAAFLNTPNIYEMIPVAGAGQFITLEYDTDYYLKFYSVTEAGDGSAVFTQKVEKLFDIADFPGLTGGTIGDIHYSGGRVYGQCNDSIAGSVFVVSYAVDESGFSDPVLELAPLDLIEVDTTFFADANALEQSFWHDTDVSLSGYRFYPDSETAFFAFTKGLDPGTKEYDAVVLWDGTSLSGESATEYTESTSFHFLQDGSFIEAGSEVFSGINHRILNLEMEELGVITDIDGIEYIGDGIIDDEHVLFYQYYSTATTAGGEIMVMYLPVASVTGGTE